MDGSNPSNGVTRDEVRWAYKLLLGRNAENEQIVTEHCNLSPDRRELVNRFLASGEFHSANQIAPRRPPPNRLSFSMSVETEPSPAQLRALIDQVAETWRGLGETRPHWSVLSVDKFLPQNIEAERDAFYESGALDVQQLLDILRHVGVDPQQFSTVMDYGCGLGRITNHLARHFQTVIGCDISSSHLALARARSEEMGVKGVSYREITTLDFGMIEPLDLWFSVIVLQHNPPPVMAAIIRRALSLLRPGGLAVFQLPNFGPGYSFSVDDYLSQRPVAEFEMHVLPQPVVFKIFEETKCSILALLEDHRAGEDWISSIFVVQKNEISQPLPKTWKDLSSGQGGS